MVHRTYRTDSMIATGDNLFERLNQLIDENLDNPGFSIEQACVGLGISRSQLYRILKEQTGLSTSHYIRQRKMRRASQLLIETDMRVSEICEAVGIGSVQNFSSYFTETFGVTPSEYRKLHQANPGRTTTDPAAWIDPFALSPAEHSHVNGMVTAPEVVPMARPTTHRPTTWLRPSRWWGYGALALSLLVGLVIVAWLRRPQPAAPTAPAGQSLAVLPFVSLNSPGTDPAHEEIMDDVHRSLASLKTLRVIARSSSDQYKETYKSAWQIGDELHVAYLLRGKVLKTSDQLQVRIELIDTSEDIRVWGHTYQVPFENLFGLTDQIVADVSRQLNRSGKGTPLQPGGTPSARALTQNLQAYNLFLQGRQLVVTRAKDQILASIERFDAALALDSTFAEALAFKATAYVLLPVMGYADQTTAHRQAERYALQALRLDPVNSTAHGVLGIIYHATYQWQAAQHAFQIALQHNPNDAQAHYWYSLLLRSMGQLKPAIQHSSQAIALDPLYPVILAGHVINCAYAGRFGLARASLDNGRDLFRDSFIYYACKGHYHISRQEYALAIADLETALRLNPDYGNHRPVLYYSQAKLGKSALAQTYLATVRPTTPRAHYDRAVVYAGLNQTDSCLVSLQRAADEGFYHRDMRVNPIFQPYFNHPRFRAVLRQYHLDPATR